MQIGFVKELILAAAKILGNKSEVLLQKLEEAIPFMDNGNSSKVTYTCRRVLEEYYGLKMTAQKRYSERQAVIQRVLRNFKIISDKITGMSSKNPKKKEYTRTLKDLKKEKKDYPNGDPEDVKVFEELVVLATELLKEEGIEFKDL